MNRPSRMMRSKQMRIYVRKTGLLLLLALVSACNDERCKYREGVDAITISANPSSISAVNGRSVITAIGMGQDNLPMPDGTVTTFVTDLGAFEQGTQASMVGGIARITFLSTGAGSGGTAHVYARAGRTVSPSIQVEIGNAAVGSILLVVSPRTVGQEGQPVRLTATVLSKDGLTLEGIKVYFSSDRGVLTNGGIRYTGASGEATETLDLGPNNTGDQLQIEVKASVSSSISDSETIAQDG